MARVEGDHWPRASTTVDRGSEAIVAESFAPGAMVSGFTPVLIATESPATNTEDGCRAAPAIELEFTGKVQVRIPVSVPPELAAAVVKALSRR